MRLFEAAECATILKRLRSGSGRAPHDWHKGAAASCPDWFAIAVDDRIRALVTGVLGRDVLLWGASLVVRKPDTAHPWHSDIESCAPDAETASVWIGLDGASAATSLEVVSRSHRFGVPLQHAAHEAGVPRDRIGSTDVVRWARAHDAEATTTTLACVDGEAVIFDGRLWHASHARGAPRTRHALLLQYARPSTPIRIPNPERLEWPFETCTVPRPPCIVVSGEAVDEINRLVAPPLAARAGLAALGAAVHPLALPLGRDRETGWKPHRLFQGTTANLQRIGAHVSVLEPGHEPHPPHVHDEEELLLVLDGRATLTRAEDAGSSRLSQEEVGPGAFAYYPAGLAHTLRCAPEAPVTYAMFKWRGAARPGAERLLSGYVERGDADTSERRDHGNGFSTQTLLDGATERLRHLHVHRTTLAPGAGYAAHVDAHDVAVVLLEGSLEVLGARASHHGVVFCAGGTPHDVHNPGEAPAVYLAIEFHGRRIFEVAAAAPAEQPRPQAAPRAKGRMRQLLRSLWT